MVFTGEGMVRMKEVGLRGAFDSNIIGANVKRKA